MAQFVAFLRGINVGGKSIIKMADLKDVFVQNGFSNVTTYIQSGNVIFSSDQENIAKLTEKLEKILSKAFHYTSKVVLVSDEQLKKILDDVPVAWKKEKDLRCYIAFVKEGTTADAVAKEVTLKEGVDFLKTGKQVLYMTTKLSGLTKSGFTKLIAKKIYQQVTMRNYNTSQKILALIEGKNINY